MTSKNDQIVANAANVIRSTLYFWWIAYLRQSSDYWWICHEKGNCQDPRLISVWRDFGNLFDYKDLDQWWQDRGVQVFESLRERTYWPDHQVKLITKENLSVISLASHTALIAVPISLDLKSAQRAFLPLLRQVQQDQIESKRSNYQLFDPSYQLLDIDPKSKKALVNSYRVHLLQLYVQALASSHALKKWGCYEMGLHLGIAKQQNPKPNDTLAVAKKKQNCVRALISQNKSLAKALISNVEVGRFPSRQMVNSPLRWTPSQEKGKNEAIADGAWHKADWLSAEFAFLNPAQSRLLSVDQHSPKEEVISILDAFGNMPMHFLQPKHPALSKNL